MNNDKATMPEYFNGFRDGYTRQTPLIDRQAAQIAMLREALEKSTALAADLIVDWDYERENFDDPAFTAEVFSRTQERFVDRNKANLAVLTATAADVEAWQKLKRDAVLEEAIRECNEVSSVYEKAGKTHPENSETRERVWAQARAAEQCSENIRALKDKP